MAVPISLEFFPPKTAESAAKLRHTREELYALKPEFCSVTYGAGGTTQTGTVQSVQAILAEGRQGAPHYTCIGATKDSVREQLAAFKAMGVRRIVTLRGDLPHAYGIASEFRYASDLVAFIREETGDHFHLDVAAYPEMHPQSRCPRADLQAFAAKVKAGANSAITQMFFNIEAYCRFVDDARALGVDVPILPGIMPITNSAGLLRFADNCGTDIPRWLRLRLDAFGDDTASIKSFGVEVMASLCERLVKAGAPGLHFYTMNTSAPALAICRALGL